MLKFSLNLFFIFFFLLTSSHKGGANSTDNNFVSAPIKNLSIVENFPLTEDFLSKIEQIQKEIKNLPSESITPYAENDNSINGLVAYVSAQQKLSDILEKNNISPKDYVIGLMALQITLATVSALENEDYFFDKKTTLSQSNVEFGKKHISRIRTILDN
ncbi:hypothetical protein [Bartonella sp. F02]|uniref:hypothetical protein n=1 Tax=Bartonella sp. F02 TaxID=2967262 RepID=UPI0022A92152|nr:hypothetical protein [Bartonella sp. F02]MCZ2327923.1 hypothetical protein [Bartonella sp. F02]